VSGGLFGFLVRQRTLVLTLTIGLCGAGLLSLTRLGSGIYPEVEFPRIVVVVRVGDMPPGQLQAAAVRPLEESLATVLGVRRIRTRVIRGSAEISLQFADGADMWRALQLTDAAIGRARGSLPSDAEIESQKITPADFPILTFNVLGGTSTGRREAAEFVVRPALSRAAGVGRVDVVGGDPREVEVVLDPQRLAALHLRPTEAARRVGEALVRRAVGRFAERGQTVTVTAETAGEAGQVERLPLTASGGTPLALGAVARVFEGAPDRTMDVHSADGEVVQVSVSRMPGASAPDVVREVQAAARALRLPQGMKLVEAYNQGELVRDSIRGVRDAIVLGILLTLGVLALFLHDFRAGALAALSVPVALLATFVAMDALGETLNLMSLGGMAVAIGLVIDDAIVVVEAVARRLEHGGDPATATKEALEEMTGPVTGTTVTTVIVLAPLAFLAGLTGRFFAALSLTLASAVALSLAFALLVLPLLSARFLRPAARRTSRRDRVSARYAAALRRFVRRPALAVGAIAVSLVAAVVAYRVVPSGFLPEMDEGAFVLDYFLPAGTSLEATSRAALQIEDVLRETEGIAGWTRRTGTELGPVTATVLNRGDINVILKPRGRRPGAEEVIDSVRERLEATLPGVRVEFVQILEDVLNDLAGNPRPLEVRILGEDQRVLAELADAAEARLKDVPHLVDYYRGVEDDAPVLRFAIDSGAAERAGLTPSDVGEDLATAVRGSLAGSVPRLDRLVPVRVRFPDDVRFEPDALQAAPVALSTTTVAPLGSLARAVLERRPSVLLRENLSPAAVASAAVEGGDLGAVARELRARVAGLKLPPGYRVEVGGQAESQAAAFRQLLVVLGLGLIAVFSVLVAQFRSARAALLVLLAVPPALAGGILFLAVTRTALNVSSMMGLVLLVGLVVKNGILLVEHAIVRSEAGKSSPHAFRQAGRRRLRPILMTTLCTLFGLLPLAFSIGAGSELQRPLAVAVIGGLLFSTATTLFLLPAVAARFLKAHGVP
jgi:CzcA family heavy metal efflux pump